LRRGGSAASIAKDGSRLAAGSWLISEKAATEGEPVDGSALVASERC